MTPSADKKKITGIYFCLLLCCFLLFVSFGNTRRKYAYRYTVLVSKTTSCDVICFVAAMRVVLPTPYTG